MLDSKLLRTELDETAAKLARRGFKLDVETIRTLEEQRKSIQVEVENLQSTRNSISKQIGQKMAAGDKEGAEEIKKQIGTLGSDLEAKKAELVEIQNKLEDITLSVPNLPDDEVPDGKDENENVEISRWGEPKSYDFEVKDHVDLGEMGDGLDFASATKITGARFIVMKGQFARLHRAIAQFMLDLHTQEHGYDEVNPPLMVRDESVFGTSQLPKFETA